jgi:hypothetical protein
MNNKIICVRKFDNEMLLIYLLLITAKILKSFKQIFGFIHDMV